MLGVGGCFPHSWSLIAQMKPGLQSLLILPHLAVPFTWHFYLKSKPKKVGLNGRQESLLWRLKVHFLSSCFPSEGEATYSKGYWQEDCSPPLVEMTMEMRLSAEGSKTNISLYIPCPWQTWLINDRAFSTQSRCSFKIFVKTKFQVVTTTDRGCQKKGNFYVIRVLRLFQDNLIRVQSNKLNIWTANA